MQIKRVRMKTILFLSGLLFASNKRLQKVDECSQCWEIRVNVLEKNATRNLKAFWTQQNEMQKTFVVGKLIQIHYMCIHLNMVNVQRSVRSLTILRKGETFSFLQLPTFTLLFINTIGISMTLCASYKLKKSRELMKLFQTVQE